MRVGVKLVSSYVFMAAAGPPLSVSQSCARRCGRRAWQGECGQGDAQRRHGRGRTLFAGRRDTRAVSAGFWGRSARPPPPPPTATRPPPRLPSPSSSVAALSFGQVTTQQPLYVFKHAGVGAPLPF